MDLYLILLILLPFVGGVCSFLSERNAKWIAFASSLLTLVVTLFFLQPVSDKTGPFVVSLPWIESLGVTFSLQLNVVNYLLVLLTALVFPILILLQSRVVVDNSARFYGLLSLAMSGLVGVFIADDLLLFYFFWELALIPVYFLASMWGGDKRAKVAFKFFIYTFLGSLIMLGAIIYLMVGAQPASLSFADVVAAVRRMPNVNNTKEVLFFAFFIAFAIKMPLFPLHTWQPDAYETTYTPVTVVLSAIMVKMGLYAVIKWMLPLFPQMAIEFQTVAMVLSVVGILYASILALVQTNIKRLIAYSSIAHIGLMSLGIFSNTLVGFEGAVLQMFNHGINIAALWLIVSVIERHYNTQDMKEMGGLAKVAPTLSVFLVIVSFANIGLPLTNAFVGEFMLFHGVFESEHRSSILFMVLAGLGIILGAVYTLNMLQKVVFNPSESEVSALKLNAAEVLGLSILTVLIVVLGVYPKLLLDIIG